MRWRGQHYMGIKRTVQLSQAATLVKIQRWDALAIILDIAVPTAVVYRKIDSRRLGIERVLDEAICDTVQGGNDG